VSYVLAAFIGREPTIAAASALAGEHRVSRLGHDLHLVELDSEPVRKPLFSDRFHFLTPRLAATAIAASAIGDIGFIEAGFFGGDGLQGSIIWRDGEVVFGPLTANDDEPPIPPLAEWPINQALRFFGVEAKPEMDEFRTVNLGRFR
jgi:hypothetical protein